MKLGKQILGIRKENKMSQEEFGKLFHVTRQTISNWENEKSYPDLQTLVDMSDRFQISLDVLLKEDKQMVKAVSKTFLEGLQWEKVKKAGKWLLLGLAAVSIVYLALWSFRKTELEERFQSGMEKHHFQLAEDGYYSLKAEENIQFTLPKQTMPSPLDFALHFHATYLNASLKTPEASIEFLWNGETGDAVGVHVVWNQQEDEEIETYYMEEPGELLTEAPAGFAIDQAPEEVKRLCGEYQKEIQQILKKGKEIYGDVY